MFKGIKEGHLISRFGMIGLGAGAIVDLLFFKQFIASGFGMFIGAIGAYAYLVLKYGRKNLNN